MISDLVKVEDMQNPSEVYFEAGDPRLIYEVDVINQHWETEGSFSNSNYSSESNSKSESKSSSNGSDNNDI